MKNFATILFLVVYSSFSVGVNILLHTCGGESEAIIVMTEAADPCLCTDVMALDGTVSLSQNNLCCKIDLKTVKLDQSQKVAASSVDEKRIVFSEIPTADLFSTAVRQTIITNTSNISPPPLIDFQAVNSVFLI